MILKKPHRTGVSGVGFSLLILFICSAVSAQAPATAPKPAKMEYLEGAVLWTQASGERAALSYQAFTLAKMRLDRDLRMNRRSKLKPAVIVDIDETVLDNSVYEARLVKNQQNHESKLFTEWTNSAEATAMPGALEFLRYADARGVRVFYVTNRKQIEKEGTARNLKKLGFPNVNDETLLVRPEKGDSSKEPRRQAIGARYRIVLLMGDNLNDFAEVFENSKTVSGRLEAVEKLKQQFGTRFIVLPNPMYGDWESSIYDYNFKLSEEEKSAKRKSYLKTN
jgi:5'-nucleotidase (lipoprotein e(P4) family)